MSDNAQATQVSAPEISEEGQEQMQEAEATLQKAFETLDAQETQISESENDNQKSQGENADEQQEQKGEYVEFQNEKEQKRFNDIYREMRENKEGRMALMEHNKQLEIKLQEAMEKMNNVENRIKSSDENEAINKIKTEIKEAQEMGDDDRVLDLTMTMADLRAEQKFSSLQQQQAQRMQQQQSERPQIDPNDLAYAEYLANETDANGNLKRPYLNQFSPDNDRAVSLAVEIAKDYKAKYGQEAPVRLVMDELDKRMTGSAPAARPTQAEVLSNNSSVTNRQQTVRLTDEEKRVANKMGLSASDYAKQKQMIQSGAKLSF